MKIAIISDIHGNIQALNAVLADINAEKCDKIVCLGDLAMAGPQPSLCVDRFIDMVKSGGITSIQGNTDQYISNYSEELFNIIKEKAPIMANALKCDVAELSPEQIDFLKNLPATLSETIDGVKILFVHGSPRRNDENIMPNMPLEEVEAMLNNVEADIVFCGHTHIPCGYQTNSNKTFVNVGSVGRPFTPEPNSCYAILSTDNGEFNVEHKFVKYDNASAAKILADRGFEGAQQLADMLISPQKRHI